MITADIERAMNRVKNRNNLFASMAKEANEYYKSEATLTFGEPPAKPETVHTEVKATETKLPNQTKNLVINEFEIRPERPVGKRPARRNNFGFTLSPIISVGRPNRK
jgi:mannose-1-phosphate guanylyltransferase